MVLTNKQVGDFVNSHYISVKINGDSLEGKQLREKYHYPGYPTVILFNQKGEEIDRIIGFDGNKDEYLKTFPLRRDTEGRGTLQDYLNRLQSEPDNFDYNYQVAQKYHERGDYGAARPYIEKFIKLDSQDKFGKRTEGRYLLAYGEYRQRNDIQSLQNFIKSTQDKDWLGRAFSDITRYYARQNKPDKVLETYEVALKRLPDDANLMNAYAWYIFQQKIENAYAHGIAVMQTAVKLQPDADHIWDTLGQLLFAAGRTEEAIAAMQKAAELNPKEKSYEENLKQYLGFQKTKN